MKKSIKKNVVFCVVCGLISLMCLAVAFGATSMLKNNSKVGATEFEATVLKTNDQGSALIIVLEEYDSNLFIYYPSLVLEKENLSLQKGQKVYFRIAKSEEEKVVANEIEFSYAIFFRTDSDVFITVESYEKAQVEDCNQIKGIACGFATFFFLIAGINVYLIVKKKKTQSNNKKEA